jgi:isoquinoline 1-oxidoreductase beta subunit
MSDLKSLKEAITEAPISRRGFLVGSVGASVVMAFGGLTPSGSARAALENRLFSPSVWFEMDSTGATLVNIAKAEMGQHVGTALARVVADELGVAWKDVSIKHVDTDPKWGYMVTGGSWSVFTTFNLLSQAGAAGRTVLLDAGAKLLGLTPAECEAVDSRVKGGGRSISYGEIVSQGEIEREFTTEELAALPIKPASERRFIGHDTTALDIKPKSTAKAEYGIDAERPGMVYARPLVPPTRYGSTVNGVNDEAARVLPGYIGHQVIEDPSGTLQGWVVAVAENYWTALKAADAISVDWTPGPTAGVSEADILAESEKRVQQKDQGSWYVNEGDVDAAAAAASGQITARYRTSAVLHFQLEPNNAVAEFRDGHWHLYSGNQWQSLIMPLLATALGVGEESITIHQYYLGGGFGRRLFGDYMLPAALTAKAIGKPVKLIFSREDDSRFDCVRSPSVQQFTASIGADKQITGIEHAAAAGWPTQSMAPGFLGDGQNDTGKFDPFSIRGSDHWYTLSNHRVRAINNELAQKTFLPGWLRSVGPGWIGWGVESFMDELAVAGGHDPLEFRLSLLDASGKNAGEAPNSVDGAKRLANVLRRVRKRSGWDSELPDGEGRGVAVCAGQERNMPTWVPVSHSSRSTGKPAKWTSNGSPCVSIVARWYIPTAPWHRLRVHPCGVSAWPCMKAPPLPMGKSGTPT